MRLRLSQIFVVLFVALLPRLAHAVLAVKPGYPLRSNTDRVTAPPSGSDINSVTNAGINRADCYDSKQVWAFRFDITGVPSSSKLDVYISNSATSCAPNEFRNVGIAGGIATTAAQCVRVASYQWSEIAAGQEKLINPVDFMYALRVKKDLPTTIDSKAACDAEAMVPTLFYLHLLPTSEAGVNGNVGAGTAATNPYEGQWISIYDLAGPAPPVGIEPPGPGNTTLKLKFPTSSTPSADFLGYRAFCFPVAGKPLADAAVGDGTADTAVVDSAITDAGADTTDAGTTEDTATTDAGTTEETGTAEAGTETSVAAETSTSADTAVATTDTATPATPGTRPVSGCPAGDPFFVGQLPAVELDKYVCANIGSVTGSFVISGLTNDQPYAIAIAATDRQGNSGTLSEVVCGSPVLTIDPFAEYTRLGGQGGNGFCAFGSRRDVAMTLPLGMVALGTAGWLARRRRRNVAPARGNR